MKCKRRRAIFTVWIAGVCLGAYALGGARSAILRAEVPPDDLSPAEQEAIRQVIRSQIEAFQRDDAAAAFALASPGIQRNFGTAENFLWMVRTSYQAVYRPRRYRFLKLALVDEVWVQKVIVIGPDGLAVMALYPMVKLHDGAWRTDGCALLPLEAKDA
jgi:hypothetical protein